MFFRLKKTLGQPALKKIKDDVSVQVARNFGEISKKITIWKKCVSAFMVFLFLVFCCISVHKLAIILTNRENNSEISIYDYEKLYEMSRTYTKAQDVISKYLKDDNRITIIEYTELKKEIVKQEMLK